METKRPDADRLAEAHDQIAGIAGDLATRGFDPALICDALMVTGINTGIKLAGRAVVASCLCEWMLRLKGDLQGTPRLGETGQAKLIDLFRDVADELERKMMNSQVSQQSH